MSPENDLPALKSARYQQNLVVNQLRRQVFRQPDPTADDGPMAELQAAEAELIRLEKAVAAASQAAGQRAGLGGAATTGLEARVELRMAQVPSSFYHLLDPEVNPLLTCTVTNASAEIRRLRVIAQIEGYSARAIGSAELDPGVEESFDLLPTMFPEAVKKLTELTRATLNVLIEDLDSGKAEIHRTYPIWLLAHNTAPLAVQDPQTETWNDMTLYLGAFVTPNAEKIMEFLNQAVEFHPEKRFIGYQGKAEQVGPQVKALYDAQKNYGINYIHSVIDFSPDTGSANQRVRLPRQSLHNRSANCIDGTVLFASLLEAVSLSPAIVIIPGHAFLAWETGAGNDQWQYLETTMIANFDFEAAVSSATQTASQWQAMAAEDPARFRLHPLRVLRTEYGITPME